MEEWSGIESRKGDGLAFAIMLVHVAWKKRSKHWISHCSVETKSNPLLDTHSSRSGSWGHPSSTHFQWWYHWTKAVRQVPRSKEYRCSCIASHSWQRCRRRGRRKLIRKNTGLELYIAIPIYSNSRKRARTMDFMLKEFRSDITETGNEEFNCWWSSVTWTSRRVPFIWNKSRKIMWESPRDYLLDPHKIRC